MWEEKNVYIKRKLRFWSKIHSRWTEKNYGILQRLGFRKTCQCPTNTDILQPKIPMQHRLSPSTSHTPYTILFLAISLLSGSQLNSCLSPAIFIHFPFDYAFTSPNRIMLYYRKQSSSMSLYYIAQSTFLERRNPSLFIVQDQLVSQLLQKPPFNLPALPAEKKRITFLIVSNFSVSMRRQ